MQGFEIRLGAFDPAPPERPGIFGEGSDRFEGTVSFTGVPLGEFRDHRVGNADTIMERKKGLQIRPPFPGSESTDIQLVALSMRSTSPITIHVGRESELWDVKISLLRATPPLEP